MYMALLVQSIVKSRRKQQERIKKMRILWEDNAMCYNSTTRYCERMLGAAMRILRKRLLKGWIHWIDIYWMLKDIPRCMTVSGRLVNRVMIWVRKPRDRVNLTLIMPLEQNPKHNANQPSYWGKLASGGES